MPDSAVAVTGTDFLCVPVKDFDAALEFYGTTLGLPLTSRYGSFNGAEFETGNLTLQVIDSAAIGREFIPHAFPTALHVDDVEAARAELESKGVAFAADTIDSGVCHMAIFHDPDGNALMFHNRYAPKT
jgi:predicted enzyme related to lactoylglutathione lyase